MRDGEGALGSRFYSFPVYYHALVMMNQASHSMGRGSADASMHTLHNHVHGIGFREIHQGDNSKSSSQKVGLLGDGDRERTGWAGADKRLLLFSWDEDMMRHESLFFILFSDCVSSRSNAGMR